MAKAFNVSENIGFDGFTYFCRRCGKAGYQRGTQVRGHLAMCPGTLLRKGVSTTTTSSQLPTGNDAGSSQQSVKHLQPLTSGFDGGLSGGQLVQPVAVVDPVANPVDSRYAELAGRVATMENHYNHVMQSVNQPEYQPAKQDFFSQYKNIIVLGAIIFFALMLSERSGKCQELGNNKTSRAGNIGEKALSKLVDVGVSKGIASLLK